MYTFTKLAPLLLSALAVAHPAQLEERASNQYDDSVSIPTSPLASARD